MRKILTGAIVVLLIGAVMPQAIAEGASRRVRGPHCGGKFKDSAECSFRYQGGQLYLGGQVLGFQAPAGAAVIRLEAVSEITGHRNVLLACATPASGACAAGGSYETIEHLRKGQELFCIVEGHGRGDYECGTLKRP